MKKINFAILALGVLLAFQSHNLMETKVAAELSCQDVSTCCGAAGCQGPGTATGCSITCTGGGTVTCCSKVGNRCICGPGET